MLIHGGPEAPWVSEWSYRWNPLVIFILNLLISSYILKKDLLLLCLILMDHLVLIKLILMPLEMIGEV